jgi:hypothetical protein
VPKCPQLKHFAFMMCHSHRSRNRMFHLGPMTSRSPRGDRAGLILYDRR